MFFPPLREQRCFTAFLYPQKPLGFTGINTCLHFQLICAVAGDE